MEIVRGLRGPTVIIFLTSKTKLLFPTLTTAMFPGVSREPILIISIHLLKAQPVAHTVSINYVHERLQTGFIVNAVVY